MEDRLAAVSGTVRGELSVAAVGGRLRWHESGTLTWSGRAVPVWRTTYLVVLDGSPWMTFADGRPFHPWRPGEDVGHPCGEDRYVGRVDLDGDVISTVWRVTGPAKDQLLRTAFRRLRP